MKAVTSLLGTNGALHAGARVGSYRLLEQIGAGGMGRVFLAERVDGEFQQRVALKLVNKGEDEDELLSRFYQERQALAMLSHPNIARLLDGGVTDDGQPYLVMEYIEGLPLDAYCEQHECDIHARVRLFLGVLAGVQHAHQRFLVHRDLKPGNILVTHDGVPKLLDFGILKWLQPTEHAPLLTRPGMQPMTLEYASPEQVKGEAVTTVSDVYALGVLFYELLTGRSPYRPSAAHSYDLQKAICEQEPEAPSLALDQNARGHARNQQTRKNSAPQALRTSRTGNPKKLRRGLAGDLDSIVLKALHKAPQQRYGSAEHFAEDLRRYLEGKPVSAREATFMYRASKFVRLHKFGVSAVLFIVLLSLGFGAAMALQVERTARERDKAQQVGKFLADILTFSDPNVARGDTITARELLAIGTARIDSLTGQPEVQAELKDLMGNIYRKLGNYEIAAPLLRSALAFRVHAYGEEHRAVADSKGNLGTLLHEQAKYDEAEPLLREAMRTYRRVLGYDSYESGYSSGNLALTLLYKGESDAAETLFLESITILRKLFPDGHQDLAGGLNNLALIKMKRGDFTGAEALFREAYAMIKKSLPPGNPTFAFALASIGNARMAQGDSVTADSLFRAALVISQKAFQEEHWLTARIRTRLGLCLIKQQRYAEAEETLSAAYRFQKTAQGEQHPYTQETVTSLGMLYEAWGKPQKAEEYRQLLQTPAASN
ncbi:serine/threonine protein kinase [candidate division KSB1 bacterium]|nr:serine/threonine protein kinase [candidate division KSB1 bacterium]